MNPLVVIPTFIREEEDLEQTVRAVKSVHDTESDVDVLLVDDGSPNEDLVQGLELQTVGLAELHVKEENSGFSKTVNIGLRRALQEGRDAVLMNADVEIISNGWLSKWDETCDEEGNPAAVAGALLLFPNGLIQHGGIYFSVLTRTFDHMWKYAPMDLPAAHYLRNCPVTAAFQFIRHSTLQQVGIYDEEFYLGWEDVDYCLRVFDQGLRCVYNPDVRAWHYEMLFRGRPSERVKEWQAKSWMRLATKWHDAVFSELVPIF